MDATIRPARRDDAVPLARIWLENARYYAGLDPGAFRIPNEDGLVEWLAELLGDSPKAGELWVVAEKQGNVVGSLEAKIVEPMVSADRQMVREVGDRRLVINDLGVDRAHWREGIGRLLMDAAEDWGRSRGATLVCLDHLPCESRLRAVLRRRPRLRETFDQVPKALIAALFL